ncbi:MAG: hypothetical protein Sapg2KO_30450 [Saprospiraceae bacterium]
MQDLWLAAFEPVNLLYTILLGFVLLYWLSVLLGAIDLGALDFDIDADLDVDLDVDVDIDADLDVDAETGGNLGGFAGFLHFFNFGKMPFMIVMTFVVFPAWMMSIGLNEYFGNGRWWFALAMFIPIIFFSLIIGKILTMPLVPIFARMNKTAKPIDYIGLICKLRLPASASRFGQAEVMIDGSSLLIEVKTESDETPIKRGETARVIGKTEDKRYYLIRREVIIDNLQ